MDLPFEVVSKTFLCFTMRQKQKTAWIDWVKGVLIVVGTSYEQPQIDYSSHLETKLAVLQRIGGRSGFGLTGKTKGPSTPN